MGNPNRFFQENFEIVFGKIMWFITKSKTHRNYQSVIINLEPSLNFACGRIRLTEVLLSVRFSLSTNVGTTNKFSELAGPPAKQSTTGIAAGIISFTDYTSTCTSKRLYQRLVSVVGKSFHLFWVDFRLMWYLTG